MTIRIKMPANAITSREELDACIRDLAGAMNISRILTAKQDEEIQAIREKHANGLAQCAAAVEHFTALAQAWAEANPGDFGKAKSLELTHGTIGFRTGQPQAKPLSGWTWDRVLEKLQSLGGRWSGYVRQKSEVDKGKLIADRAELELKTVGVRIVQQETFYVEPNLSKIDSVSVGEN